MTLAREHEERSRSILIALSLAGGPAVFGVLATDGDADFRIAPADLKPAWRRST